MTRLSDLDVTKTPLPVVGKGSVEDYYQDSRSVITTDGFLSTKDVSVNLNTSDLGLDSGADTGAVTAQDVTHDFPELTDVESVVKYTYFDEASQTTKAKLVFKIRNSSGKTLLGVDARLTIIN